ncbi:hypothetical protein I7I48_03623 [Histoplasma ohiense]|nr:hypothetical protein I7I48_03623 [Histoplasma ohiense (nom. inval.)]
MVIALLFLLLSKNYPSEDLTSMKHRHRDLMWSFRISWNIYSVRAEEIKIPVNLQQLVGRHTMQSRQRLFGRPGAVLTVSRWLSKPALCATYELDSSLEVIKP